MYAHIQDSMLHRRATDRTFRSFVYPRAPSRQEARTSPVLSRPSAQPPVATLFSTAFTMCTRDPQRYLHIWTARAYLLSPVAVMARPPPLYTRPGKHVDRHTGWNWSNFAIRWRSFGQYGPISKEACRQYLWNVICNKTPFTCLALFLTVNSFDV